ncbi:transforming growth factor-beta-induced protein ig-h3 [Anthonomus grandis grandis]|uniref:transforming growth factor-beta-induced protein ig-h3 n=1 Tax=Anthonomus grandis grandis TaxID=2921223 RepID=UPI0021650EF2|nr:transforming growth factor-beta-induced protein ig-h3 [Anthonomus grandis grandis]
MLRTSVAGQRRPTVVVGVAIFVATALTVGVHAVLLQLPDTTGIDGHLTANHSVDHFFSLWLVFHNDDVQISDKPFTIFAPKNSPFNRAESLLQQPELVKKLLLDHVILGTKLDLTNMVSDATLASLGSRNITLNLGKGGNVTANNVTVLEKNIEVPNGILVIVDSYLFPDEDPLTRNVTDPKREQEKPLTSSRTHAPPEQSGKQQEQANVGPGLTVPTKKNQSNTSFVENVMEVLSYLKSRVRVFQHFVSRSNVSGLLKEGEEYTVFVPTDHAFQRWHPIDWGFYPFSVPEFTESVIVNHFVKGRLKQENIKDGQVVQTLGGKDINFKRTPSLTVNGAAVVKGDTPVEKGNIMFIGEVLFVSESVVSKLHQQHRDKETPPLLAFPWFGAQFLSHAFLALERDKRFTHITRFLNLADLAPHVSGAGYTFFVPTDSAFAALGLDKMPDNYLSNGEGLQILLNHFVKGRLYDKELKNGTVLTTLGNQTLLVNRTESNCYINQALILESEVFVYNLGTMFYIDKVLHNTLRVPPVPIAGNPNTTPTSTATTALKNSTTTALTTTELPVEQVSIRDIERVTEKMSTGGDPEVLFGDATHKASGDDDIEYTTTTPSVSSVAATTQKQNISSPK